MSTLEPSSCPKAPSVASHGEANTTRLPHPSALDPTQKTLVPQPAGTVSGDHDHKPRHSHSALSKGTLPTQASASLAPPTLQRHNGPCLPLGDLVSPHHPRKEKCSLRF